MLHCQDYKANKRNSFMVSKISFKLKASPSFVWIETDDISRLYIRFPRDIWETSAEIPYWWRLTTHIWVVLLIGWSKFHTQHDQSESVPRSWKWRAISIEFLRSGRTSFREVAVGGVAKCRLFFQAIPLFTLESQNSVVFFWITTSSQ